jgi:uncharacterized protein (TIGR03066 family)
MKKHVFRSWHARKNGPLAQDRPANLSPAASPADEPPARSKGRLWVVLLLCLLGSGAVSFVAFRYAVPWLLGAGIPRELVGTWQVSEGDLQGATLEINWYGSATAVLYKQGKKQTTNSTAKVVGNVLLLTSRDESGAEETVTQTIMQLTADELILRDEDHNVYQMQRVRS